MKPYEINLKQILEAIRNSTDGFLCSEDCNLTFVQLHELVSLKLIRLDPAGDDTFYISLLPGGYSHFCDIADRKLERRKNRIVGFISGILTTVIGGLILKWLQG